MESGTSQLQPEDQPEPAEGTVEGVDEEGRVSTPERQAEEPKTTFDPETGNLAQPETTEPLDDDYNDQAEGQADGEAA
jgi:hypothetical protein